MNTKNNKRIKWYRYKLLKISICIGLLIIIILIILINRIHVLDVGNDYNHYKHNNIHNNIIRKGKELYYNINYLHTQKKTRRILKKNNLDLGIRVVNNNNNNNNNDYDDLSIGRLWKIYNNEGVLVRSSLSIDSDIVSFLPVDTYILVNSIITLNDTNTNSNSIHIYYPIKGYISLSLENHIDQFNAKPFYIELESNQYDNDNNNTNTNDCVIEKYLNDIDIRGGDIPAGHNKFASVTECCNYCHYNNQCSSWTFTPDGSCWLKGIKHNDKKSMLVAVKAFVSGFKSSSVDFKDKTTNQCCLNDDNEYISTPSYRLKIELDSIDWTNQFPIGTGKLGAIVGGTYKREVIPISIGNFFVKDRKIDPLPNDNNTINKFEFFKEARLLLSQGRTDEAKLKMKELKSSGLGMFQYISDITLITSNDPLTIKKIVPTKQPIIINNGNMNSAKMIQMQKMHKNMIRRSLLMQQHGRQGLINSFENVFNNYDKNIKEDDDIEFVNEGILDMKNGIARSNYITEDKYVKNYTVFKIESDLMENNDHIILMNENAMIIHSREWFASNIANVIVGSISCHRGGDEAYRMEYIKDWTLQKEPCLHAALKFSRDSADKQKDLVKFTSIEKVTNTITKDDVQIKAHSMATTTYAVEMQIRSTKDVSAPSVNMCGIVYCYSSDSKLVDKTHSNGKSNSVICNNAYKLEVILALDSDGTEKDLGNDCWKGLSIAVEKGIEKIKLEHITQFSEEMSRIELTLSSANVSQSCAYRPIGSRVHSFAAGCLNDTTNLLNQGIDLSLAGQAFQYGRYLLISSAKNVTSNLQGIWTDGPTSSWSGDYHLNINMQEIYWSSDVAGMSETMKPLVDFIQSLSINGRITAKELYGSKTVEGWVAHGFTDNTLNAGLLGDLQWSLCVTCGAWLALHIFDHISYKMDYRMLIDINIPILRGVILFFKEYLYKDEHGIYHTGPTTSPENSYEILTENINPQAPQVPQMPPVNQRPNAHNKHHVKPPNPHKVEFLAFSTALDISVLRQVANAFKISIQWAAMSSEPLVYNTMDSDLQLVTEFENMIINMPGLGLPIVDPSTGKILEYPTGAPDVNRKVDKINEAMDPGHRHFSAVHWLYPGMFQLTEGFTSSSLLQGARLFMKSKRDGNGEHTSWSAAWAASLYARLRDADAVQESLTKILERYTSNNLLSLHPPLMTSGPEECSTCFVEEISASKSINFVDPMSRGMQSASGHKFQIDGNLGYVAAVCEMLMQSHIAGYYLLLPALPKAFAESGKIRGLTARGDTGISISWKLGQVSVALLQFKSNHPWLRGLKKTDKEGFFGANNNDTEIHITISTPNKVQVIKSMTMNSCMTTSLKSTNSDAFHGNNNYNPSKHWIRNTYITDTVLLPNFPCSLIVCSSAISEHKCLDESKNLIN